jgi:RNA recognition motif-containing protein
MNIYVSNLGFNVQDSDLKNLFTTYGPVTSAKVIFDKMTNQSRGFGFVEMPDEAFALIAIEDLNGKSADGRFLKVTEAKPREESPRRNSNW